MKGHAKEVGFYLEDGGELWRHYEQIIRFENGCADDNHI